jgi:hypothetical protein
MMIGGTYNSRSPSSAVPCQREKAKENGEMVESRRFSVVYRSLTLNMLLFSSSPAEARAMRAAKMKAKRVLMMGAIAPVYLVLLGFWFRYVESCEPSVLVVVDLYENQTKPGTAWLCLTSKRPRRKTWVVSMGGLFPVPHCFGHGERVETDASPLVFHVRDETAFGFALIDLYWSPLRTFFWLMPAI